MASRREYASRGRPSRSRTSPTPSRRVSCCSSAGSSRSTRRRELVGGDDVVAQARAVFENMRRGARRRRAARFADVVKVTVFLTDIDDRPLVNPVRQEVFGETRPASTLVEVSALVIPGAKIEVECVALVPRDARTTPSTPASPGSTSRCEGAAGWAARGRTLLVKDLIDTAGIRTTYGSRALRRPRARAARDASSSACSTRAPSSSARRTSPSSRGACSASNEWYGTVPQPGAPGTHDGRLVERATRPRSPLGSATSGSAPTPAARSGCPSAACELVGLKSRLGRRPDGRRLPARARRSTRSARWARTVDDVAALWSVLTGRPVPEPRLDGLTVGLLRQAPELGDGRDDRGERRRRGVGRPSSSGSARGSSRRRSPAPTADTWPRLPARGAPLARGDLPEPRRRVRRRDAREARGRAARRRRRRSTAGYRSLAGVAAARAGGRPLRQPVRRRRLAGGGRGRARRPPAALVVPALGQPHRLGRPRDRQPAARRAARRDGARGRPRAGSAASPAGIRAEASSTLARHAPPRPPALGGLPARGDARCGRVRRRRAPGGRRRSSPRSATRPAPTSRRSGCRPREARTVDRARGRTSGVVGSPSTSGSSRARRAEERKQRRDARAGVPDRVLRGPAARVHRLQADAQLRGLRPVARPGEDVPHQRRGARDGMGAPECATRPFADA